MTMDLPIQFENAVAESKNLNERPSNEIMLQLYAQYKQATEGDIHIAPPTNPFDLIAKAKFQAWEALRGVSAESAMQSYIDLVQKLKGG